MELNKNIGRKGLHHFDLDIDNIKSVVDRTLCGRVNQNDRG